MKKKHTGPQIAAKLRQADVLIGRGKSVPEVCKEIEVSEHTHYRWRRKYGGMSPDMIKQLKALQKENARLRKVVADQAPDVATHTRIAGEMPGGNTELRMAESLATGNIRTYGVIIEPLLWYHAK